MTQELNASTVLVFFKDICQLRCSNDIKIGQSCYRIIILVNKNLTLSTLSREIMFTILFIEET